MKRFFRNLTVLLSVVLLAGCAGATKIKMIKDAPGKYNEQHVTVKGKVVQTYAVPFLGQSLVRIDDGSGRIWIKPEGKVPFEGENVKVKGKLKVGLTIANKNLGFIVIEGEEK